MKYLKLYSFFMIMMACSSFVLISCEKEEEEWRVTAEEVPQAVIQIFTQSYPGALIKEYSAEVEEGQQFYEISCVFEGRKIDVLYQPDGKVAEIEEVIPVAQLPEIVKQNIPSDFTDLSIDRVEKIQKQDEQFFELKVLNKTDQNKYELLFSAKGNLLEKSIMKEEEHEGENEEDDDEHDNGSAQLVVPELVKDAFKAKFPDAEEVEWGMESAKEYEAEFEQNEKKMSANFDMNGKWLVTETVISEKELLANILNALENEFHGFMIEKAEMIEEEGKALLFEIKLEKGEQTAKAILNASGQFIKNEVENEAD